MKLRTHPLPGTDLRLSTFCCGLGDLFSAPRQSHEKVLEAFIDAGGNFFDTAHCYSFWLPGGNGLSEISIGEYVRKRGLKDIVIATKGGHPSAWHYRTIYNNEYLSPGRISADLDASLARLDCDAVSLYYLHRDDPRVPVGEIIDLLNMEIDRGRIRYPGVSNWSVQRISEANEYARAHNRRPLVISSPPWSLAERKAQPQAEISEYREPADSLIAWHREHRFPVAPYTPTAHGFFAGPSDYPEKDYGTAENHQRRERVHALAKKRGASAAQIALAWLISHPFPVFPILGTKNPGRMTEALGADSLLLTEAELAWLACGEGTSH